LFNSCVKFHAKKSARIAEISTKVRVLLFIGPLCRFSVSCSVCELFLRLPAPNDKGETKTLLYCGITADIDYSITSDYGCETDK